MIAYAYSTALCARYDCYIYLVLSISRCLFLQNETVCSYSSTNHRIFWIHDRGNQTVPEGKILILNNIMQGLCTIIMF